METKEVWLSKEMAPHTPGYLAVMSISSHCFRSLQLVIESQLEVGLLPENNSTPICYIPSRLHLVLFWGEDKFSQLS
ncbi:hypothetical protein TNCV_3424111 [Trichonephila clavipes]|nr:hypothetical protein TNCV_3424111 [Trichonephila clavipes]